MNDCTSPQVSRTFLSILADLKNTVICMVTTCPLMSKSSSHGINPLVTVPSAPITIVIALTFIFHSFFRSLARSVYLSFRLLPVLSCDQPKQKIPQFGRFSFFGWLSLGLVVWPRLSDLFVSLIPEEVCVTRSSRRIPVCGYTFVRLVKFQFLAQFPVDYLPHPVVSSLILFLC